jgi:hypothetical protein
MMKKQRELKLQEGDFSFFSAFLVDAAEKKENRFLL